MAVLAYLPMLLTAPGTVAADTKEYLYLDPGRLLSSAVSMWDPSVAGGEVTHQNIGYLFPMGPFFWLFSELRVPVWVAQRLWLGTLLFTAGAGVYVLARLLGVGSTRVGEAAAPASEARGGSPRRGFRAGSPGRGGVRALRQSATIAPFVAGVVYMLSPYFLQYSQRISALLLPWSGLGWLLAFTVLTLRRGGWRYPALFGIVVAAVGGLNATALLYIGIAPLLYLIYAVASGEARPRRALVVGGVLGLISLAVSLWWIAGLEVEAAYGINVLKFTETVPAIASASVPSEILRGLGYWYFYGTDQLGPWLGAAVDYETRVWLIGTSFALVALAVVAAVALRWRHRAFFVLLVLVGLVLSVGANPYADPSFVGRALEAFMTGTTAGDALRSTDRATPLVILGLAVMLGAGVSALWQRLRPAGLLAGIAVVILATVNGVPLLGGAAVEAKFSGPSQLPSYMRQAAAYLDAQGDTTRVLIEPGEDFAAYDFGTSTDSVWPGLMTRPSIQRQQLIDGSIPTANLLDAFDSTLQLGTYEPASLAPIARLLSAGDVVLQSNLAYWWYATPKPQETWSVFARPPAGIGKPIAFGPPTDDDAPYPYQDINEATLAMPAHPADPPALAVFPVSDPRPIYRAEPAEAPLVVDGDGSGLVAAAATGLLDDNPTILYSGSLAGDPTLAREALTPGSQLVVTDSNDHELTKWDTLEGNTGELLPAVAPPTDADPSALAVALFPGASAASYSNAVYRGAAYVTASAYGNAVSYTPEDRAFEAFDGNVTTAWTVAAFADPVGNWIQIATDHPVSVDHLDLVQPLNDADRYITAVTITFDGGRPVQAQLGASSRTAAGQTIDFARRSFRLLRITIDATNATGAIDGGASGVGLAEIRIPGVRVSEYTELPTDLLSAVGGASLSHRLTFIFSRDRVAPIPPRSDPEPSMNRLFSLPTARTFTVSGTARISALIADNDIDDLLGGPDVFGGAVIGSDARLPGDLDARAIFAFDGNDSTAWMPGFGATHQVGAWMEMALPHPVRFDRLHLVLAADGRHSIPTAIRITSNAGSSVLVRIPPVRSRPVPGATAAVEVRFPAVRGNVVRFTIAGFEAVDTPDYYSAAANTEPVGIAEIGVPGVHFAPEDPRAALPDICRSNLLSVDGRPVPVRVVGTVGEAETLQGLEVEGCGSATHGIRLGPGQHTLVTAEGQVGGYDLDRVVLDSGPGGGAMPLLAGGRLPAAPGTLASAGSPALAAPRVTVESSSASSARLDVAGVRGPFWLVLGESIDRGWQASVVDGPSLGSPILIDGYADGWYVDPPVGARSLTIVLGFDPQHGVDLALAVSGVSLAGCIVAAVLPLRRRRRDGSSRHRSWWPLRTGRSRRRDGSSRGGRRHPVGSEGEGSPIGRGSPSARRAAGAGGDRESDLGQPALGSIVGRGGRRPPVWMIAVVAVCAGAAAAALVAPPWGPAAGVALAVAVALAATVGPLRLLLVLGSVGAAVAAGLSTVLGQAANGYPPGGGWPAHFSSAGSWAWLAVLALAADVLVEAVRRRTPSRRVSKAWRSRRRGRSPAPDLRESPPAGPFRR